MTVPQSKKAGLIPYHIDENGVIRMLFMVSSDPKFGGARPMISKGTIDPGEDELTAALREAHEELGLTKMNIISTPQLFFSEHITLTSSSYDLDLFFCKVKSRNREIFDKPCFETKFTVWMTEESFASKGRRDHKPIVSKLFTIIKEQLNDK